MAQPFGVGIIGCGNISGIYFQNLGQYEGTRVVACADLDLDRAKAAAAQYGVPKALTPQALLEDPDVEVVLNLTVPKAHFPVSKASLEAGKHSYAEKPLSLSVEEGHELVRLAESKGLRLGCAPDTVLGGGIQTCRKLIDDGAIGEIVGVNAFMMCRGHETWHPSPEFYYEVGGGPMFDMGPYYLSALIHLIGPIHSVSALARASFPTRTITSQPKAGKVVEVETPTHIVGLLEFDNGAIGQITTSFDVARHTMPCIEVYGSEGSLLVPDPNGFGGVPKLMRRSGETEEVALTHGFSENHRGVGVLDMGYAARAGREHRANGRVALHVLEAMSACLSSGISGRRVELTPLKGRPEAMPENGVESDLR